MVKAHLYTPECQGINENTSQAGKQSTSAPALTINLRVRGPCRIWEKKLVLADEKGTWLKRTLHLEWASVSLPEMEEMEQQEKGEKAMSSGYEEDNRWAVVSALGSIRRACQQDAAKIKTVSNERIKKYGVVQQRTKGVKKKKAERTSWRRNNCFYSGPRESRREHCKSARRWISFGLEFLEAITHSPDLCVSYHFTHLLCSW